jgi:hypothetical protein
MLNLDLIVFDDIPNRATVVSSAADFPRRGPVYLLLDALTPAISGVTLVRLWMAAIVAVAFMGMVHRLRELATPIALGAGALYAMSPFLLTRLGVGHIGLAAGAAMLPLSIDSLLHPSDRPRRTFLWMAAYAAFGYAASALTLPLIVTGLVVDRGRRVLPILGMAIVAWVPWLVPAVLSLPRGGGLPGSESFAIPVAGVADGLRLALGYGFWQPGGEVGSRNAFVAALACAVVALAYVGEMLRRDATQRRLLAAGLIGLVLAVAPTIPLLETVLDWLTGLVAFGWLREPHRFLVLFLLWAVTSAAYGLDTVASSARSAAAVARFRLLGGIGLATVVIVATGTAWWGLDGRLAVRKVPESWGFVSSLDTDDGAVVVLPWSQYYDVALADGRRSHHPLPYVGPGDIIFSHDLELGEGEAEQRDTRELAVEETIRPESPDSSREYGNELSALGVRWVVADVASIDDFDEVYGHLLTDDGLDVTREEGLVVLAANGWKGTALAESGNPVRVTESTPWWTRVGTSEAFTWYRAPLGGWTRGTETTDAGIASIDVPAGARHLIYWPALISLLAIGGWSIVVGVVGWRERACSRSSIPVELLPEVER